MTRRSWPSGYKIFNIKKPALNLDMKLKPITIDNLALMICGDKEYTSIFPYRSSSQLTDFFRSINLSFIHKGETRRLWLRAILDQLNTGENEHEVNAPSEDIIKIIEQLLDPIEYLRMGHREEAIQLMTKLIESEGLSLDFDERSKPKLKFFSGEFISTAVEVRKTERVITFTPEVFKIPEGAVKIDQVSVMMPFSKDFDEVYAIIKETCQSLGLECKRADEIWKDSAIIQDVFDLIFTSSIIVADLSRRNSNVFYEIGIAHTLGKFVIPIVQNTEDISFDIGHHRVLKYSLEKDGGIKLKTHLQSRLKTIMDKFSESISYHDVFYNVEICDSSGKIVKCEKIMNLTVNEENVKMLFDSIYASGQIEFLKSNIGKLLPLLDEGGTYTVRTVFDSPLKFKEKYTYIITFLYRDSFTKNTERFSLAITKKHQNFATIRIKFPTNRKPKRVTAYCKIHHTIKTLSQPALQNIGSVIYYTIKNPKIGATYIIEWDW